MSWYENYVEKYGEIAAKELMRSRAKKVKHRPGGSFRTMPDFARAMQKKSIEQFHKNKANVLSDQQ